MENAVEILKRAFGEYNAGRAAEAERLCRVLVEAGAQDAQLFFLLGMALHKLGRDIEAQQWLRRAGELQPEEAGIWSGLGVVWQKLADYKKAADYFSRAAKLEPEQANHFYSLGNAVYELDDLERAAAAFERAVELNPSDAECWNNLGKCLKELNRIEESILAYDRAVRLKPDYLIALQGRAISLMAAGRLAEGYRDYELRWQTLRKRKFAMPEWGGQAITGKTLFLHAEQGFGDGIQSARYAQLAKKLCGRVILECRPELKTLLAYSGVADEVIAFGEPIPAADFAASVISLPGLLNFSVDSLPGKAPYLKAPARGEPLAAASGKLKVGLIWAGSPTHREDAKRSLRLAQLAPVLAVPEVMFYSLQVPVPKPDVEVMAKFPQLLVLGGFADYLATASAVAEMDLIISVDTSVAHLAGALAKPAWTLLQFAPDARWFAKFGERTPWYPTMRLFRQRQRNEWGPVIAEVAEELGRFSAKQSG